MILMIMTDNTVHVQVTRPDGKPETFGLLVLDEPTAKQSDPTGIVNVSQ